MPDYLRINFYGDERILVHTQLKGGFNLSSGTYWYTDFDRPCSNAPNQSDVGKNIHLFDCHFTYYSDNRISPEGIKLDQYEIKFYFTMDDRNCDSKKKITKDCIPIMSNCSWGYFKGG